MHLHEEELPVVRRPREERLRLSAEPLPDVEEPLDASHLQSAERLRAEEPLDASHLQSAERLRAEEPLDASHLQSAERLRAEESLLQSAEEPLDADLFAEHPQSEEESPDARLCPDAELLKPEDSKASRTSWARS